jgi:hypothetical protein
VAWYDPPTTITIITSTEEEEEEKGYAWVPWWSRPKTA